MKKTAKRILKIIAIIPAFILCYLLLAVTGSYIPVNTSFKPVENGIAIYVLSNGVHTDIVVPAYTEEFDWTKKISPEDFNMTANALSYIGFGWGDKGFYLETPTWAELKFSTAFKATFGLSSSAMHVTCYSSVPKESARVKKVNVSVDQYRKITEHIEDTFQKAPSGEYLIINGAHYGKHDRFYEAHGRYHLFNTCNGWTNSGLKKSGINTALWAPFAWSVMRHRN